MDVEYNTKNIHCEVFKELLLIQLYLQTLTFTVTFS